MGLDAGRGRNDGVMPSFRGGVGLETLPEISSRTLPTGLLAVFLANPLRVVIAAADADADIGAGRAAPPNRCRQGDAIPY